MEEMFNITTYGTGAEGVFNWLNSTVNGMYANLFLAFIWIATIYTLSKSEWKLSNCSTFAFFITFLLSIIMKLFMDVSEWMIFVLGVGLAISIFWSVISDKG